MNQNLIGEKVKVIQSSNELLQGIEGRIIDETKNMLIIESKGMTRKVLKKEVKLQIGNKEVSGKELIGKPEDKIKSREKVKARW